MEFANKEYLFLLLLLIPYMVWYLLYKKNAEPSLRMSDTFAYQYAHRSWRVRMIHVPFALRVITFIMLILVLARPQRHNAWNSRDVEGIDIMLAMDVSTSMLTEDLKPNRIEAAKNVASEFISGRPDDNIGLTIFAGEAFTQCPMTTDHQALLSLLHNVGADIVERGLIEDGTAIGMGLANAVSRLKDRKTKSRVVILLTDGSNNRGDIPPMTAANIAGSLGIRVYTIAVGSNKPAPYPVYVAGTKQYVNLRADVDTQTLGQIASVTDGNFYRATNTAELKQIYKDIDELEKTKMSVKKYRKKYEAYQPFAIIAVISLLLEVFMRTVVLRRIP